MESEPSSPSPTVELAVVNARIVTLDAKRPSAQALAVSDGRFVKIGSDAEVRALIDAGTRVVDAAGATILPGLIDAHLHLFGEGYRRIGLDLVGTASLEEVLDKVRRAAPDADDDVWLRGRGWDQNDWPEQRFPSAADLDVVAPTRPVILSRIDGHAIWVNSRGLALAGIDRTTPDPDGGRIERGADGQPTGVLVDNAENLVTAVLPPYSREEMAQAARLGAQACLEAGLTGVHEPGIGAAELAVLEDLFERDQLHLRVYAMLSPGPALERYLESGPELGRYDDRLTVRAAKLYADGALGSRGAALLADYQDDPGNRGLLVTPADELADQIGKIASAGLQPCVHAIGDRANQLVLDIYERVLTAEQRQRLRPRIEHAQVIAVDDLPRFQRLGVIASMQPTHCTSDMAWATARLGPTRVEGAYAWRTLQDTGARLAFGSDAPVESVRPLWGLYAAVTRMDHHGQPAGGFRPDQAIDIGAALAGFTSGAAYAAYEEASRGSIESGKLADFVIVDRDPHTVDPSELLELQVLATYVGGRAAYQVSDRTRPTADGS